MNWKQHKQQLLKDSGFKKEYEKLSIEYKVAAELIRLRVSAGLTQAELAKAVNTQQASIARMESGSSLPSLTMIRKVADVLNADIEIHFKRRSQPAQAFTVADKKRRA